jgi:hypothetical protein
MVVNLGCADSHPAIDRKANRRIVAWSTTKPFAGQVMKNVTIRAVDRSEAAADPTIRAAFEAFDALDLDESPGTLVNFSAWVRHSRIPHDRREGLGALLHGALCRSGGCDGSGGQSSIAYDHTFDGGAHAVWVERIADILAAIAAEGALVASVGYHRVVAIGRDRNARRRTRLGRDATAFTLARALHRLCADVDLMPAGCGNPSGELCLEAVRGALVAEQMRPGMGFDFIDSRFGRLAPRQPGRRSIRRADRRPIDSEVQVG